MTLLYTVNFISSLRSPLATWLLEIGQFSTIFVAGSIALIVLIPLFGNQARRARSTPDAIKNGKRSPRECYKEFNKECCGEYNRFTISPASDDEQFLRSIYNGVEQFIFVLDVDETHEIRYVGLNPAAERSVGKHSSEIIGKTPEELFGTVEGAILRQHYNQCLQTRSTITYETCLCSESNGETNWTLTTLNPLKDSNGKIYRLIGTAVDITAHRQIEKQLRESQQLLQCVMDNIPQLIFWKDRNSVFLGCNRSFAEAAGLESPDQVIGKTDYDLAWARNESDWYRECDRRVMESGSPELHMIETLQQADGTISWIDTNKIPLHDADGTIVGILGTCEDITDRKQTEKALRQQEEILRQEREFVNVVIENVSDGVVACDANGILKLFNRTARDWHGCDPRTVPPDDWADLYNLYAADGITPLRMEDIPLLRAFNGESVRSARMAIVAKGQAPRYLVANGDPLFDEAGQKLGAVAVMHDITERMEVEKIRRQSEAQLREQAQREQLLNQLASQIRSSLEFNQMLATAVQAVRDLLQIDRCLFVWRHLDTEIPYWEVVNEAVEPSLPSYLGLQGQEIESLSTADQQQILRVDDVQTLADATVRQFFTSLGYRAILCFPIQTRSGKVGLVVCAHSTDVRPWCDDEVELLQAVAAQLAIAIDQADLYKQSRLAAATAQTQAKQLEDTLIELKQTQAQMVQSEKMSSLGQLVAGVAHEINNPVNFIYGNLAHANDYTNDLLNLLNLYQHHYPKPIAAIQAKADAIDLEFLMEDMPKLLLSMRVGAERIQKIVTSLRIFSRMDEAEMKAVDIHDGIESTLMILQHRLKSKLERPEIIVNKAYGKLPMVECYAGQLNQVFMNILSNAIDAMEEWDNQRSLDDTALSRYVRYTQGQ
jgi:PAS domain S-box-containing protein